MDSCVCTVQYPKMNAETHYVHTEFRPFGYLYRVYNEILLNIIDRVL